MIEEKNLQNEKLNDEELEKVSGGTFGDTVGDSRLLYLHGILPKYYNGTTGSLNWKKCSKEVDDGWAKAGITCITKPSPFSDNLYFLNGKPISRTEAYNIVEKKYTKIR